MWQAGVRELSGELLKGAWEAASAERGCDRFPELVFMGQEMVPVNILQTNSLNVLPVSSSLEFPQKKGVHFL